jgi:hypothetical protein
VAFCFWHSHVGVEPPGSTRRALLAWTRASRLDYAAPNHPPSRIDLTLSARSRAAKARDSWIAVRRDANNPRGGGLRTVRRGRNLLRPQ